MSFWSDLKNYFLDLIDEPTGKEVPSVKWSGVEHRFEHLLTLLRVPDERKDVKQIIQLLNELLPILETKRVQCIRAEQFQAVRAAFLEIWHILLSCATQYTKSNRRRAKNNRIQSDPKQPKQAPKPKIPSVFSYNEISVIYRAITFLMSRREFDIQYLNMGPDGIPRCSTTDMLAAYRYRVLLYHTQAYLQSVLNFIVESGEAGGRQTYEFLGRGFAVTCFRLPKVLPLIVSAVGLSQEQQNEIESHFEDKLAFLRSMDDDQFFSQKSSDPQALSTYLISSDSEIDDQSDQPKSTKTEPSKHNTELFSQSSDSVPTNENDVNISTESTPQQRLLLMAETFPNLYQWPRYHVAMREYKSDSEDDKLQAGVWLDEFRKREMLFFMFLDHWIRHVKYIARDRISQVDWPIIRGYRTFVPAFVHAFKQLPTELTKDIQDCSCSIILTDSSLVNLCVTHVFSKTNVYNVFGTLNAMNTVEIWFKQLAENNMTLSKQFDTKFFCRALDIIFQTDHHQMMTRALGLVYVAVDAFVEEARRELVIDLLLHKYFFRLFLHWDSAVRNCYHQFLLFKAIRIRRSRLISNHTFVDSGVLGMQNMEKVTDTVIYSKIESYIFMLEDQVRPDLKRKQKDYPKELEVYTNRAMEEYRSYSRLYAHWEKSGSARIPKLIPYSMLPSDFKTKTNK